MKTSRQSTKSSNKHDLSNTLGATNKRPDQPDGPKRPPRVPMNSGKNLDVPEAYLERDKFAYRFFLENDISHGRIAAAKSAWWEHVTDENGQNIQRNSGASVMYLMKLELKYWEEDQKLKHEKNRATMDKEAMIREGEYAPSKYGHAEGGESAITRT